MKLTKRIGTMAIVIDEEAEKTEFLNSDHIAIVSFTVNVISGLANVALAFGGMDSTGKFHMDMNRSNEIASITINREQNPGNFDALFCENGQLKCHFPKEVFNSLIKDILVPVAYRQVWGGKYPEMEVAHDGEIIFKPPTFRSAPTELMSVRE